MPVDLSSLLSDALTDQGYQVEDAREPIQGDSGASYPVSLVATRNEQRYLVDVLASRTVRDEDISALDAIVDDTGLDGALVLALEGTDLTPEIPKAETVDVWDREEVDQAVGHRILDGLLAGDVDPDDIGPTPTDGQPADAASTGTATSPDTPTTESTPGPEPTQTEPPQASPPSQPETDPTSAQQPDTTDSEPPTAEPAQTAASNGSQDDSNAFEGTGVDQRELLDPEDMLERAEQLSQKGEIDDGDAELIVEDDEPAADPEPAQPSPGAEQPSDPSGPTDADPAPATDPDPSDIEPADDGSDAELLDSGPTPPPGDSRPGPDADPPEPETATTARTDSQPEDDPDASTSDPSTPSTASSPAAAAGPSSEGESFLSGATIEPQVDEAEARRKAEEVVLEAQDARLELLPFRVYRYQALLEGGGHSENEEGEVWVSTQSGAVVDAPDGDRVDDPDVACERFQGSLSRSETREAARDHLLDALERRDEIRQDYNESAVIERVELAPDPESMTFEDRGKAFAPRWRVDGPNQSVFVDAVTGELVKG